MKRRAPQSELGAMLRTRFATNVRHFRRKKGMKQHELASAAGLCRSFVSQVERGRFSVTLETVGALSAALGICPTLLIRSPEEGEEEKSAVACRPDRRLTECAPIGMAEAARAREAEFVGNS